MPAKIMVVDDEPQLHQLLRQKFKNEKKDEFGEEKFEICLKNTHGKPLVEIAPKVVTEVQAFSSGSPQTDDITCLVLRYLSKE